MLLWDWCVQTHWEGRAAAGTRHTLEQGEAGPVSMASTISSQALPPNMSGPSLNSPQVGPQELQTDHLTSSPKAKFCDYREVSTFSSWNPSLSCGPIPHPFLAWTRYMSPLSPVQPFPEEIGVEYRGRSKCMCFVCTFMPVGVCGLLSCSRGFQATWTFPLWV